MIVKTSRFHRLRRGHRDPRPDQRRTYAGISNPRLPQILHASAKRLPLRVRLLSNALYVLTSADEQIPPGSELLAIQGMPVPQVVEIMVNHLSGDGDILTNKDAAIGDDFYLVLLPVHRAARYFQGGVPTGCEEERGALRDNSGSSKKSSGKQPLGNRSHCARRTLPAACCVIDD
jgi:hypothetical protein